ncbi:MAG: nickel pincer cofactor biosynthesis protein LarC [Lachnospiraceae bacterium]|nr:nickel pincer cofactor biosynthesis protein LarC [Lachnospiraceae bacterium]
MSEKILYLECNSGISGDMTVAALLDLGASREVLMEALESLPLTGYSIEITDVYKSGIRACDFNVILDAAHENHDHDMAYLYGDTHAHDAAVSNEHAHTHADRTRLHEHAHTSHDIHTHTTGEMNDLHEHEHAANETSGVPAHHHHHDARNLNDIAQIIMAGHLTEGAKSLALKIFRILAQAEAKVHGKSIDEVHFHEVGAVDSIVDITAAAVCLDNLHPDQVVVSALTDGTGQIRCQHGLIPVPVPAVTAIAANEHLQLKIRNVEGELVTPTGAAIAAAFRTESTLPDSFEILHTGFGAGKRTYTGVSGFLRAMLLQSSAEEDHDTILSLETNIDDCTGEALSFTLQQLLKEGALDAFCIPIYMKKNRPAYLLKVLCQPDDRAKMEAIIFRNTTTIGIRFQEMHRTKLDRRIIAVETPWGMADVKSCMYGSDTYYYPENDSVKQLALLNEIGFSEMYGMIQSYTREKGL